MVRTSEPKKIIAMPLPPVTTEPTEAMRKQTSSAERGVLQKRIMPRLTCSKAPLELSISSTWNSSMT